MLDLTAQLAAQLTGYFVYDHAFDLNNLRKINYITAANGMFRVEKTPIGIFSQRISEVKDEIPGLYPMFEGFQLTIPKIPFKYISMALSFYQDVNAKDKTEASLLFFWNHQNKQLPTQYADGQPVKGLLVDGQLIIYVPIQRNSSTLSEFGGDTMVDWLRQNTALLCETHSHNTMAAFFSGTDDANENMTQCYFVWGKVTSPQPETAFRYVSGNMKVKTDPSVLFDWPVIRQVKTVKTEYVGCTGPAIDEKTEIVDTVYKGPYEKLSYPLEWMEQHTKKTYATGNWTGKYGSGTKSYGAKAYGSGYHHAYGHDYYDDMGYPYSGYEQQALELGDYSMNRGIEADDWIPGSEFANPEMGDFLVTEYDPHEADNLKEIMSDLGALVEDLQWTGNSQKIINAMKKAENKVIPLAQKNPDKTPSRKSLN